MDEPNLPGKTGFIESIPFVLTEEHQQVFPYWQNWGMKKSTLVHIDSHHDLSDENVPESKLKHNYYQRLSIGNFICPAVHYGIIKDMFWISPFQKEYDIYLQYLNENILDTKITLSGEVKWKNLSICSDTLSFNKEDGKLGKLLRGSEFKQYFRNSFQGNYILDVDLDAFAKEIYGHRTMVEMIKALNPEAGIGGWKNRIKDTCKLLKKLPKPNLITMTRSQGQHFYVPKHLVDEVQRVAIDSLTNLYKERNFKLF